jgi:hypothetical protein
VAGCCSKRKITSTIKPTVRERTTFDTNVRLIREVENVVNDVVPHDLHPLNCLSKDDI